MLLVHLVAASETVRATSARRGKTEALAAALARLDRAEAAAGAAYLAGETGQRPLGIGWAALRDLPAPAPDPTLTVADVDAALDRLAQQTGPGSQDRRRAGVADLFGRATAAEQAFLRALVTGELRQGALTALVTDAVARASGRPLADVRRALMLCGDLGRVATLALHDGPGALAGVGLRVGTPVLPMLAAPAADIATAVATAGDPADAANTATPAAVEWKIDGVRIQVHRAGTDVAVFTRSLDDITARVPEVVEAALAMPATSAILDGEAIVLRPDGRPQPFQLTASRIGSRTAVDLLRGTAPLTTFLFDVLHLDGQDVLDRAGAERFAVLAAASTPAERVPRIVTADPSEAGAFFDAALSGGHEGVVVKSLSAPYAAGRRGKAWLKVKPRHTLDLVVLAAEWGHGRRRGWLSNLHLGARDPVGGGFVMLGKTFKGLTDPMLTWQTERLLQLEVSRNDWQVFVAPELVVEVAFDGVQTSPRYPGGVALRFARVLRHRPDKRGVDADPLDLVRALHDRG